MKPPENTWDELTEDRKAAIDARDISSWSMGQLRGELSRRLPFQDREPVAYWISRLEGQIAERRLRHEINSIPKHQGLRIVPDKGYSPWRYRIIHVQSGEDLIGTAYPDNLLARTVRRCLWRAGDWTLDQESWTTEQMTALMRERETVWWND